MEKYNLRKISKILIKHFSIILNFIYEPNSEDIGDFLYDIFFINIFLNNSVRLSVSFIFLFYIQAYN